MKGVLRWCLRLLYGFRAINESAVNLRGPALLLPNHVSWWDWLFIGVCLENDWRFVTSSTTAELSWVHRLIMVNRRTFPVDMNSPYAVKHMAEYLQKGGRLVLFPEGRLSCTGSLMKLFDGTGFLIFKTHAKVVTAFIRGAERLPFSRNPNQTRWFPRVSVHFSNTQSPPDCAGMSVTESRILLTDWLRERMIQQRFETEMDFGPRTLPEAIRAGAHGRMSQVVVQDMTLRELTYRRLFVGAAALASQWRQLLAPGNAPIGVLLPNANAFPVALLSLWEAKKIPAILNYTTGPAILEACVRLAEIKQVLTSRTFVDRTKLDLEPLRKAGVELLFLEDVRLRVTHRQKWAAFLSQSFTARTQNRHAPEETAVILFTSGSEGDPKGVQLTHRNLLANIRQMLSVIDLMDTDRFFNALPLFHCFGLTVGLLLPLVTGSFVLLYVSPLHYRVVPSALYNLNCTIFFATNTLLNGYARKAHPYDFRSIRYVFAGAEKLQESTINLWMQKFGVRVLEGYGATECSPCLSLNTPMHPMRSSAGQFLPGIEFRLEPVEGIQAPDDLPSTTDAVRSHRIRVGRLFVKGANIMRGYLNKDANARFQSLAGWYDTGDIAGVDRQGFVYILGRLKRFAKISGEMVSLTALEDSLSAAFPQYGLRFALAIITRPDERKGERIVAVVTEPKLTLSQVQEVVRQKGFSNLALPREIKVLHELPRLGTGKINHRELEKLV